MQPRPKTSKIYSMKLKRTHKIIITVLLILLLLVLSGFLFLFSSYNKISMILGELDAYRISKNIYMNVLGKISPAIESFSSEVLAMQSIEEYIGDDFVLDQKVLEAQSASLAIESVKVSGNISEGITSEAMERGFWHFPTSSLPGKKGNVVIIGHRFKYIPPATNTFFNLDKVSIGDQIKVSVGEEIYTYVVTDTKVAEPNDVSVIQQTDDYRLTLITCTPLWTSKERLVITAKLDKLYKKV